MKIIIEDILEAVKYEEEKLICHSQSSIPSLHVLQLVYSVVSIPRALLFPEHSHAMAEVARERPCSVAVTHTILDSYLNLLRSSVK